MAAQQSVAAHALGMDQDMMAKVNSLLPILKESVTNVVQHAVYILHNTSTEDTRKSDLPAQIQSFIKIVEDFHNICDQIQIWLKLAVSSGNQTVMAEKFCPEMVGGISSPQDPNQTITSYSDYMMKTKKQIAYAQKLKELLTRHTEELSIFYGNWKKPVNFD